MKVRVIRSGRKTIGLEVRDGEVLVRAPYFATEAHIRQCLEEHAGWIDRQLAKARQQKAEAGTDGPLTREQLNALADKAVKYIPERVRYYAPKIGVTYGRITIRNQKTRWGSCSAKGNLNFNCLLMLTPPEVIDAVVVHELCHRKQMNHSQAFYAEILKVFPDYQKWNKWLKDHGGAILKRMTG